MIDNIGKFWIVTKPTELSVIEDICFERDIKGMFNQVRGGLKEEDIKGLFRDENDAKRFATDILKAMAEMKKIYNE